MAVKSTVRVGRVSSVNYQAGTYTVTYADRGGSVTREINAVSNGVYKMPEVGQVVPVSHNSNGTAAGVTPGTVWNKTNKPAEGYAGLYRRELGRKQGKAYERYDDNTGVYTQYVDVRTGRNCKGEIYDEAGGPITLVAAGQVSLISSKASASIQGDTGVGIVAGTTITLEAGSYVSVTAVGDYGLAVGGDTSEEYTGEVEREYKKKVTDTYLLGIEKNITGKITVKIEGDTESEVKGDRKQKVEGNTEAEVKGDRKQKIEGNTESEVKGDSKQTVEGNIEKEITGDLTATVTGTVTLTVGGATVTIDENGNVSIETPKLNVTAAAGDVTVDGISLVHHKHADGGAGEPQK